jgi:multidrug resistance efflux pump
MDEVARRAEAAAARLEAVRAQTEAARDQESGARTMLGYTRLLAPFSGVVTARMADPGTLASPGVPLLQVDQAGALQLQTTVDESAISAIHKG